LRERNGREVGGKQRQDRREWSRRWKRKGYLVSKAMTSDLRSFGDSRKLFTKSLENLTPVIS
jgi:hypothetical protein